MAFAKSYCIIKKVRQSNGQVLNVIMIDSSHEVLEFSDREEAENWAKILTENSDSGWEYITKEI